MCICGYIYEHNEEVVGIKFYIATYIYAYYPVVIITGDVRVGGLFNIANSSTCEQSKNIFFFFHNNILKQNTKI